MATFAAPRTATADPRGDERPVLSVDVADATSVDVELASGARAVAARSPSRRRLYVVCGVAAALAVIAVVVVYHAMEASKISETTGDVMAVSVQDNCRSAVSTPAAIGRSSAAAFFQGAADVDITAQLHNPSALDATLTACTATVKARRSAGDDGLAVLVGTATDTVVPAGHASVGIHATLALSNDEDAVAMLTQLLDVGIGAAAEGTSATAAALDFSTLPFSLDASVTCTVKPVMLGLTPFGVTKTFLVPDLLKNARPEPSAAVVADPDPEPEAADVDPSPAPTPTPAPSAEPTPVQPAPEPVAVSTQNPLSHIATMTGVSMTKDGESVVGVDVDAACVAGTLPEGVTFTPPATSLNLATSANARPLATLSFPRVCIGCTDEEVHTLLALSPGLMGILAAGPLVASAAERSGAHDPFGLNEPLGIYATGKDGTMCLSHEVIAAVNGPVALSRAVRGTMATASHEQEDVLHIADLAKLWGADEIPNVVFARDRISMDGVDVSATITLPDFVQGNLPVSGRLEAEFSISSTVDRPHMPGSPMPVWDSCVHARVTLDVDDTTVVANVDTAGPNDVIECVREGLEHMLHGPTRRYKLKARVDETPVDASFDLGRLSLDTSPGNWEFRGVHRLDDHGVKAGFAPSNPHFTMLEAGPLRMTLPELAFGFASLADEVDLEEIAKDIEMEFQGMITELKDAAMRFIEDNNLSGEVDEALAAAESLGKEVLGAAEEIAEETGVDRIFGSGGDGGSGGSSSNDDNDDLVITGSLRCPGAPVAPVQVRLEPFITKHKTLGITVELRTNPMVNPYGTTIMDALGDALCQVDLPNGDLLHVQTMLTFGDTTDSGPFGEIADSLLADIRQWVADLAPRVSLAAGPNLSQDIDIDLEMRPAMGGDSDLAHHKLSGTVSKSAITNAIRNAPAAFVKGHNVKLAAWIAGEMIQLVEYEGTGSGLAGWHRPSMMAAGQVQAKVDVHNHRFGDITLLDQMTFNIVHELFDPPTASGQPWLLHLDDVASVEFRPSSPSTTGHVLIKMDKVQPPLGLSADWLYSLGSDGKLNMDMNENVFELPVNVMKLLDLDGEIAFAGVALNTPSMGVSAGMPHGALVAQASIAVRIKNGREVHVEAQTRVHDVIRNMAHKVVEAKKALTVTTLEMRMMGEHGRFHMAAEINGAVTKLAVEDINTFDDAAVAFEQAGAPNHPDPKWWVDSDRARRGIQVLISVGTPDWLQLRVTSVTDDHDREWGDMLRPAIIIMEGMAHELDVRSLLLPQEGSITTVKMAPNAAPGAAPLDTWDAGKIWVHSPHGREPHGNDRRHLVVSLGEFTPEAMLGDSLEDFSGDHGFRVQHFVEFDNPIVPTGVFPAGDGPHLAASLDLWTSSPFNHNTGDMSDDNEHTTPPVAAFYASTRSSRVVATEIRALRPMSVLHNLLAIPGAFTNLFSGGDMVVAARLKTDGFLAGVGDRRWELFRLGGLGVDPWNTARLDADEAGGLGDMGRLRLSFRVTNEHFLDATVLEGMLKERLWQDLPSGPAQQELFPGVGFTYHRNTQPVTRTTWSGATYTTVEFVDGRIILALDVGLAAFAAGMAHGLMSERPEFDVRLPMDDFSLVLPSLPSEVPGPGTPNTPDLPSPIDDAVHEGLNGIHAQVLFEAELKLKGVTLMHMLMEVEETAGGKRAMHMRMAAREVSQASRDGVTLRGPGDLLKDGEFELAFGSNMRSWSLEDLGVARWDVGPWGTCSRACGTGTIDREVKCVDTMQVQYSRMKCSNYPKPANRKPCFLKACVANYKAGPWGACDTGGAGCGQGTETRTVTCVDGDDVLIDIASCASKPRLSTSRPCFAGTCAAAPEWVTGVWTACSATCGGGTRTRAVTCMNDDGAQADNVCTTPKPATSGTCNTGACEEFDWVYGPWTACSNPCGAGKQSRLARCKGARGTPGTSADCANASPAKEVTYRDCTVSCDQFYYLPKPWSTCDATCGGGSSTRVVVCMDSTIPAEVAASNCVNAGLVKPPESRTCNSNLCAYWQWQADEWQDCSAECQGTQTRAVTCVDAISKSSGAASNCAGLTEPRTSRNCNVNAAACSFCFDNECAGRGTCADEVCTCDTGYEGVYCQKTGACDIGFDKDGVCCTTVLNAQDACCASASAVLDFEGNCCESGVLDACLVCDGTAVSVDARGVCCSGEQDAGGICCEGTLDGCGVCDGQDSCQQTVEMSVSTPAGLDTSELDDPSSDTRQQLDTDIAADLGDKLDRDPESVVIDDVSLEARRLLLAAQQRLLAPGDLAVDFTLTNSDPTASNLIPPGELEAALLSPGDFSVAEVSSMDVAGVCGNAVCESGERCDARDPSKPCCADDCPFAIVDCPTAANGAVCNNKGVCLSSGSSAGECQCHAAMGYAGDTCEQCAVGFAMISGSCLRVVGPSCTDGTQNGDEIGTDCGGTCPDACPAAPTTDNKTLIIAVAAGAGGGALLGLLLAACCCCVKKPKTTPDHGAPAPTQFVDPHKPAYPPMQQQGQMPLQYVNPMPPPHNQKTVR